MKINIFDKQKRPKITIVTEPAPGWVLRWISERYAELMPNTKISTTTDDNADINLYINYALFDHKTNIDVGYFTHREVEGELVAKFDQVAAEVDWCIAMSEKTAKFLPDFKTSVNLVPPDKQFMKGDLVIGVVGTEKPNGRKRYDWLDEVRSIPGIRVEMTNGKYKWEDLPAFYESIDYLLITSENEGGPLPLVEALAMRKPVITTDVGFANEYTAIKYRNLDELKSILDNLVIKQDAWDKSTAQLMEVLLKLYKS